jgi:cobalt-precorrin 5A hydrolase
VSAQLVAGLGCRSGCAVDDVIAALDAALGSARRARCDVKALYAPEFRRAEAGLLGAAAVLDIPLLFLPLSALQLQRTAALSASPLVEERFGVPSIAETAALAGSELAIARAAPSPIASDDEAGAPAIAEAASTKRPRLLGPRMAAGGATCALAELEGVR